MSAVARTRCLGEVRCDALGAFVVGEHDDRTGIRESVFELGSGPPRVERNDDGTDRLRGPERDDPLGEVAGGERDAIAGCTPCARSQRATARTSRCASANVMRSSP